MSQKKAKPSKKQKTAAAPEEREWTKEDSAAFAEHLEERGFTIVSKTQLEKQNKFIQSVTSGLNVADPENAGRQIAVVWQDHLAMLNDIARAVMGLGLVQADVDEVIAAGDMVGPQLNERLVKARTVIEKIASHLADKEKKAREAVKYLEVDESDVAEAQAKKDAASNG